jgi:hypothetical protein
MKPGFEDIMAVELKKELAERYFGFRKMIEEDTLDLVQKMKYQLSILEKRISFELIRIYILLKDDKLIHHFMELTGWEEKLFYEPYITESETIRKKVFNGIRIRGLTRGGRFKNLVFDAYERLVEHTEHYRGNMEDIMGFMRSMDSTGNSEDSMGVNPDAGSADTFEQKMRIEGPPPIDPELVVIAPLVPLPNISREFKNLVDKAYKLHGEKILADIAK